MGTPFLPSDESTHSIASAFLREHFSPSSGSHNARGTPTDVPAGNNPFAMPSGTQYSQDIDPNFIDAVAHSMGLQPDDDYWTSLHDIPKLAPDMTKGHMQLCIYQTGIMYSILKELRAISEAEHATRPMRQAIMLEVHARLEGPFVLTEEQKMIIRLVTGELLLDPNRVQYTQLDVEVEMKIREKQKDLRFFNIFGNLARQRILNSTIRRTCSSLRNAYQKMLRDSVIGVNTSTLDDFVTSISTHFTTLGRVPITHSFVVHVGLLRRFVRDYPHISDRMADDDDCSDYDDDYDDELAEGVSRSASTQPDSPAETEESLWPSSPMSNTSYRDKKRRRLNAPMPQPKGSDFWSMVEMWFTARMQPNQLGTSWSTPAWAKYIEETLKQDRARFKPVPTEAVRPVRGIGSMQRILEWRAKTRIEDQR